jgi:hypothetical protein
MVTEIDKLPPHPQGIQLGLDAEEIAPTIRNPRVGDLCPVCRAAALDYDGMLNLTCHNCGYSLGGCYT